MNRPKDNFFQRLEELALALTYDDVRLRTGYSEVMPADVSLETKFSRQVSLRVPLVSAAMDTVTEHELAIEIAKLGGLGIIHRNNTPKAQATEVARVKYHLNGLVLRPVTVQEDETIASILRRREEKRYSFHSFPVVNCEGKLVGILTGNDFDFCTDTSLPASAVMSRDDLLTAPEGTSLDDAFALMHRHRRKLLPIVDKEGRATALYTWSDAMRIKSRSAASHNVDSKGQLRVGAAVGTGTDTLERADALCQAGVDVFVIDTAHGDSKPVIDTICALKHHWRTIDVVAGNISEAHSVERLIAAGVDGIKVGQGPGSICTTRKIAGIGTPQVSAIYHCSRAAEPHGVPVCADGGLRYSGDITVALGAGADSVMLGSLLAGTKEAPGDIVFLDGRQWKSYRGMGSLGALVEGAGSRERYRQSQADRDKLVPEGIEGMVPYKGNVAAVVHQYLGGLRSGMGYVGAASIEELQAKADFIRISPAGEAESHPHDVYITKEAPNYRRTM